MRDQYLALSETSAIRSAPWPTYDKGHVVIGDEEAEAALRAIRGRRLFRYDNRPLDQTEVGQFEIELAAFFGVKHALAVSTGTAAIALALFALGVGPGDEVLCSSFGFPATPSAILLAGAKPILFEVDEDLHPDLSDLERKITSRTKAVLVVHMRGQSGDIVSVASLCRRRGIHLVEDAVPIMGAKFNGKFLGTFGAAGAFSTQSDKSLNTGEGGFLLTDDDSMFEKAVALSGAYEGRVRKHCDWPLTFDYLSLPLYNFRMDEIRGALGRSQLSRLPERLSTLQANYRKVSSIVSEYSELQVRRSVTADGTLGDSIVFRVLNDCPGEALEFGNALRREGIEARYFGLGGPENVRAFWSWRFLFPGQTAHDIRRSLPNSAKYLDQTIDIPLCPLLGAGDIDDLDKSFNKIISERRNRRAKSSRSLTTSGFSITPATNE